MCWLELKVWYDKVRQSVRRKAKHGPVTARNGLIRACDLSMLGVTLLVTL